MNVPKKIDLTKPSFISNGTKYYLYEETMGYIRASRFEELIPLVVYGASFQNIIGMIIKAHDLAREANSDGARHDLIKYLANMGKMGTDFLKGKKTCSVDIVMDFCCLFFVTEDEDCTIIDERIMDKKKEDWKKDVHVDDFFLFAQSRLKNFTKK